MKETVGKITGSEKLELKGKIQNIKADFGKSMQISGKADKTKNNIAGIINRIIEEKKER